MLISLVTSAFGDNPFLDAKDDKRVAASFHGTEWGDEIEQDELPLTARVVTTRIAKMLWGAVFKIEFTDLKTHAPQPRKIQPNYFIVTNDRIVLLNRVAQLRFRYFGQIIENAAPAWISEWRSAERLPQLVSLEITFEDARQPPVSMIVALRQRS